jgi:hypothetical protein
MDPPFEALHSPGWQDGICFWVNTRVNTFFYTTTNTMRGLPACLNVLFVLGTVS